MSVARGRRSRRQLVGQRSWQESGWRGSAVVARNGLRLGHLPGGVAVVRSWQMRGRVAIGPASSQDGAREQPALRYRRLEPPGAPAWRASRSGRRSPSVANQALLHKSATHGTKPVRRRVFRRSGCLGSWHGNRMREAQLGHPVQGGAANGGFGLLSGERATGQGGPKHGFQSGHGGFG